MNPLRSLISRATLAALALVLYTPTLHSQGQSPAPDPFALWNQAALFRTPETFAAPPELNRNGMRALFYSGLSYKGKPTRVFAWLGIPPHRNGERVPAVVFVHGGGGTASDSAVRLWMQRGYACLSMDTTGSYPGRNLERHADGGPRGGGECFAQIGEPPADQWMFHAVADVALANSLLRAEPEIDPTRIGLTGLSWGGVVTAAAAGVDNRFCWAAPVYGCGFMDESEYFQPVLAAYQGPKWMALWDPSRFLKRAKMPMLWINGTNDEYFQLGMWQKSVALAAGPKTISLRVRMPHSGPDGERPDEIRAFADSLVRRGEPLPKFMSVRRAQAQISATVNSAAPLAHAELVYTIAGGKWSKRRWETQPAIVSTKGQTQKVIATLPAGCTTWYVRVEDASGLTVTTGIEELSAPIPAPPPLPEGTVYVSPGGDDANSGTHQKPVASLLRARDLARTQPRSAPVNIVLGGGTYYLTAPLELGEADSGHVGAEVTWSAAPGQKVILSGGAPITGWKTTTVNGKPAWSVTLPEVKRGAWYFRTLYATGKTPGRRGRARLPNTGFFEVESVQKRAPGENDDWLSGRDRFFYRGNDLTALSQQPDRTSAEAIVLTQWCESHLPLEQIDPITRLATFGKFTIQNFGKGDRYWVENTREALDLPGEWTLNRETGELIYLPHPGETPNNTTLIAPRLTSIIYLDHASHIIFRSLTLSHNEWWFPGDYRADGYNSDRVWAMQQGASAASGAIFGDGARNISVLDCEIAHNGSYAIVLGGAARSNRIERTVMQDLGAGGVRIGPRDISRERLADEVAIGNVVSDCRIVDGGHLFTGAVGIWLGHTRQSEIVHNEIADLYYTGISAGWVWGFGELQPSSQNTIAWNHIHHLGKNTLGDGAGIYLLGRQIGTIIDSNVVHDIRGNYASRGIYLDDGSSEMIVRNNLSYNNKTANFFQWKSKNNLVENNIFAFGDESQVELGGAVFNGGADAMRFTRNIVVVAPGPLLNAFEPKNVQSIYHFDRNLIWNPAGGAAMAENARTAGWDTNSIFTDPRFVDLTARDFRLKPDSPALRQIGFVPVDWSQAGPRKSARPRP